MEAVNRALRGVISGYLVGLMVKGVGYRMEPVEDPTGEVREFASAKHTRDDESSGLYAVCQRECLALRRMAREI